MKINGDTSASFYLSTLAGFFALVWLLPNHAAPWAAFHQDALCAIVLLVAAGIIYSNNAVIQIPWHGLTLAVLCCAAIPMLQFVTGQILWFGTAWINTAYLLGAGCSIVLGASWDKSKVNGCSDFCFTAITLSGLLSVVIAVCQWLGLSVSDIWLMGVRERSYANLGQPNQAATLYLLALLGAIWFYERGKISLAISVVFCVLLIFGLALTGSRTGYANLGLIALALIWWSYKTRENKWWLLACCLIVCLFASNSLIPVGSDFLYLSKSFDWTQKSVLNGRLEVWHLMLGAASKNLLWGYGWGQAIVASLGSSTDYARLDSVTGYSHNFFLDIIIWNGLPIGAILIFGILAYAVWLKRKISTTTHFLLLLFLGVLFVHAMTEFPIYYAYFLLPACLMCGVLLNQLNATSVFVTSRIQVCILLLTTLVMLSVTLRDYFTFEANFVKLRFEKKGLLIEKSTKPPDLWVLTDLEAALAMGRKIPEKNMRDQDLRIMENTTLIFPSVNNVYTLALAYELNGRPKDAKRWLGIGCQTSTPEICRVIKEMWANESRLGDLTKFNFPSSGTH